MIDIRDYDIAIVERVKTFYPNTHWINRPSLPLQELRDRKVLDGKDVEFPIVTVRRTNCPMFSKEYNSWSRAKSGQTYLTGDNSMGYKKLVDYDPELYAKIIDSGHKDAVSVVNSTFDLTYYIDIISLERDNFDTLMVELQENFFTIPYIGFYNIKSDGSQDKLIKDQACHFIVEEIEDTSDLENFDSGNALYRATITVKINAYIYRKFKQRAVESINLLYKVTPDWLYREDCSFISDYLNSELALKKVQLLGFNSIAEYIKHLGYNSVDEFIGYAANNQFNTLDAGFDLGPDGISLVVKLPHK